MLTGKISLEEIRANRDSVNLQPKSYKMHPVVCKAFDKMVLVMRRAWPERAASMLMLRPDGQSIADPYGLDTAAYRATRDEIAEAVAARTAAGWL